MVFCQVSVSGTPQKNQQFIHFQEGNQFRMLLLSKANGRDTLSAKVTVTVAFVVVAVSLFGGYLFSKSQSIERISFVSFLAQNWEW